ncbi:pimeloyl-ACP methyl ester carboxylesterase [Dyadobacter sp. BE34]|uniref:Pimeloyl-ACP methyl ester carboxylesterase n=1 Tax=Dyadobacter fermentans TaxID=94254 RepID=A0ABU1QVN5_9BACT|nr:MULTISPECIES: alpha/beta hydrolase [Dyadobacter]MDR6805201.1 pimeloyl-ACP methyl ester carboxylesterase [Dyadobacter fermentans]MDR7043039.1 pimeloyl-ACP methyl ester carboxylesterase [Dyadobacter sp. BE242]MDR7197351.1 pimeloyl-ACP methyl ester carboxylesterase [Dyadobacter sp. BE34]MDR7215215.1 pimeloyl-ACP methyl ester carboxylesterase [Dyadobacter sp. BE31]MDR7262750.1 pimeloyl-ACP methyl ester carboxylesterase [Dyadobacter sp. BE32]
MKLNLLIFLCCWLAGTNAYGQIKPDTALLGRNPKAGHFADLRGVKLYYEVYGSGKPVLFVHGNGGSMRDFRHQLHAFAKSYKVILVDSRAQGRSEDKGDSLSYEMMADDLHALLEHLKIDSCNVVGWSDGGINALLLALRHPEKVRKLAATGANLWPDSTALDPWLYKKILEWDADLTKQMADPVKHNQRKLMHLMAVQPNITLDQLHQVQCPSLIIGGDHDVIIPEHTVQIARAIPKSYLWILPNSGHSTLVHYAEEFNRITMAFFEKPFRVIREERMFE